MSPNSPIIHCGLDVAKSSLDLHCQGQNHTYPNTPAGLRRLTAFLLKLPQPVHLVAEATGGYEQPLIRAAHAAGLPLSLVEPARVRHFAQAQGLRAKTDALDAALLARFGQQLNPRPLAPLSPGQARLRQLVRQRTRLVEHKARLKVQERLIELPELRAQHRAHLRLLEKQVAQVETWIEEAINADPALQARSALLRAVPSVGPVIAAVILAELPELGSLNRGQAASLAGLCPFNRDSGKWKGKRWIQGGRATLRKALYQAAVVSTRHNPHLRELYQHLKAKGKPSKVALITLARHLLNHINSIMKNYHFELAN